MLRALLALIFMTTAIQHPEPGSTVTNTNASVKHASGTFEVKVAPTGHAPDPTLASLSLDKQYHGDLEATAKGEMLSAGNPATGNAGYVAIERVTGKLAGKTGTFALIQLGTMASGSAPQITATVVPGSGTGDLTGISGAMQIIVANGKHLYVLDYLLTQPARRG